MEKLSVVCYIIRNVKTNTSALALKIIYQAFFPTWLWVTELYSGETCLSSTIERERERERERTRAQLGLLKDVEMEFYIETCLRN